MPGASSKPKKAELSGIGKVDQERAMFRETIAKKEAELANAKTEQ